MTEAAFFILGAVLGGAVAWWARTRTRADRVQAQVRRLLADLRDSALGRAGNMSPEEVPGVRELRSFLEEEWVPREEVRERTVHAALDRMGTYLRHRVEAPLRAGLARKGGGLRREVESALDAVEDLEFFLEARPAPSELVTGNLTEVVQEVTREFGIESPIMVKVVSPSEPLEVRMDPETLKDALFLILHNAGEFGGGSPVQVILARRAGQAQIRVRDKGPGFSSRALLEAAKPFYSTSVAGLGLGLPHARKSVVALGGELLLRNLDEGGAEVEITLPLAE